MGWCNYVILPKYKVAIEVPRNVEADDAEEINKALNWIIDDENCIELSEIQHIHLKDFEVGHARIMLNANRELLRIAHCSDIHGALLYALLSSRDFRAELVSEHSEIAEKFEAENWTVIRR